MFDPDKWASGMFLLRGYQIKTHADLDYFNETFMSYAHDVFKELMKVEKLEDNRLATVMDAVWKFKALVKAKEQKQ